MIIIKLIKRAWNFFLWLDQQCMNAMLHNKKGKF
jgi:hypothetical protein